jgi:arylsulfatase A-like enzyme/Flp pilus assembly protein TadD
MAKLSPRKISISLLAVAAAAAVLYLVALRPKAHPNLVLIVVDTLRRDHLSCYGYEPIETPHIDSLAAGGVRFAHSTAHVPITLPSISTIMSSNLPPTTGVHYNEGFYVDSSTLTLAEMLKTEGYATRAVVGAVVIDSITGLSQGFDVYDDRFSPEFKAYQPVIKVLQSQLNGTQRRAEEVTDRALEQVDSVMGKPPFFLFVHYFDPHFPKDPPPPYASHVDPSLPIGSHERQIQLYDGEIMYTDEHVGRLIDGLRQRGLLDNTLIVFTADHGEGLDEHGERTHAYFTYGQTLNVPLIFSMPGKVPSGVVSQGLARHIDIVPTVLDILGIRWRGRYPLQGVGLYPFDKEKTADFSYFECAAPFVIHNWCGLRGVRTLNWKLIEAPRPELYDLRSDPHELNNLIQEDPQVADSLKSEMYRIIAGLKIFEGGKTFSEALGNGKEVGEFQEKLRALGYVGATQEFHSKYEEIFDPSLPDPKDKLSEFDLAQLSIISLRWGLALMQQDSLPGAVEKFSEAIQRFPDNADAHFYLGLAYRGLKQYERADEELRTTLKIDPTYVQADLARADLMLAKGDSASARASLEAAYTKGIHTPKELVLGSRLWDRLGEGEREVTSLDAAIELDPKAIPPRVYLAEYYLRSGDLVSAFPLLQALAAKVAEGDSLAPRIYYGLGRCDYSRGETDAAEEMFLRVVALDSTAADAYNQLGLIYDDKGNYEKAISSYRKALSLNRGMEEVHSNLGVSYYKMGRLEDARREFETYLSHVTDKEEAARLRALIRQIGEAQ